MAENEIRAQVVYATPEQQIVRYVLLGSGSTVLDAIHASGITDVIPDGSVDDRHLGIFGRKVSSDRKVSHGDRIEIYRELAIDPMTARRLRAR
jgi:putative ubiquitin-RnfH superfamily antitoxin RatB of RatAB toxin-antitoxin module